MVDPTASTSARSRRRAPPKPLIAALLLAAILIAWLLFRGANMDTYFTKYCVQDAGLVNEQPRSTPKRVQGQ